MQFNAWLDTSDKLDKPSRREQYKGTHILDFEPEYNAYWLIDAIYSCGIAESNNESISEVSWHEIKAWCEINNQGAWLANTIKRLSRDYVTCYYKYFNKYCEPPIEMEHEKKPVAGAEQLKAFLLARK